MDVLNAFNQATEEGLATDTLYTPNFGQPTVFVYPRRVMLGARLNLGSVRRDNFRPQNWPEIVDFRPPVL